jgi:hypothetical protein
VDVEALGVDEPPRSVERASRPAESESEPESALSRGLSLPRPRSDSADADVPGRFAAD